MDTMPDERRPRLTSIASRDHFDLLVSYGRSQVRRDLTDDDKNKLWLLACEQKGIRPLPLQAVIEEWKAFLYGESKHSKLSVSANVDPNIVCVSVLHRGAIVASHSTTTHALLLRLLEIFAASCTSKKEFKKGVADLCEEAARK